MSKTKCDFGLDYLYKVYKDRNPDSKINKKIYTTVVKKFFKKLIPLIYKGLVFRLPAELGIIGIQEKDIKIVFDKDNNVDYIKSNLAINYRATKELWEEHPDLYKKKYIYHDNEHTNYKRYKIKWRPPTYVKNISVYAFRL